MLNVIVNGADGRMGRELCSLLEEREGDRLLARVDPRFEKDENARKFKRITECTEKGDVVVDFSFHTGTQELCLYAAKTKTPLVVATTGQTERERGMIALASKKVPIFYCANMSLGVSLTLCLTKIAAKAFPEAEIDIVEIHHDKKADAPSGTSLLLAEGIRSVRPSLRISAGRIQNGARDKNELFVHSLRLGSSVGSHEVIFALPSQTVTIKHEAHDRRLFAEGALVAAHFVSEKENGLYSAEDILE